MKAKVNKEKSKVKRAKNNKNKNKQNAQTLRPNVKINQNEQKRKPLNLDTVNDADKVTANLIKKSRKKGRRGNKNNKKMDEDDVIEVMKSVKVKKVRLKPKLNQEMNINKSKSKRLFKRRSKTDGLLHFYTIVLSWLPKDLLMDMSPESIGFSTDSFINSPKITYKNIEEYYDNMMKLCLEECRAILMASLIELKKNYDSWSPNYFAYPFRVDKVSVTARKGLYQVECFLLASGNEIPFNGIDNFRPGCIIMIIFNNNKKILGTISNSQSSAKHILSIWVMNTDFDDIESSGGMIIKIQMVTNLVSFIRIISSIYDCPNTAFLHKMLGNGLPKHIKFSIDSDEEYDNNPITPQFPEYQILDNYNTDGEIESTTIDIQKYLSQLNFSQQEAVLKCLLGFNVSINHSGNLSLVQGPPGCGKTHVLSILIHIFVELKLRVVVCAPSNKAISVALETYLESNDRKQMCNICIFGVEDKIKNCATVKSSDNSNELEKFHVDNISNPNESQSQFSPSIELIKIVDDMVNPKVVNDVIIYTFMEQIKNCVLKLKTELFSKLYPFVDIDISTLNYNSIFYISHNISIISSEYKRLMDIITYVLRFRIPHHYATELQKFVDPVLSCFELCSSLKFRFDYDYHQNNNYTIDDLVEIDQKMHFNDIFANWKTFMDSFFMKISNALEQENIYDELISTSDVIFSTLNSIGSASMKRSSKINNKFDILIIDEAAQVFEPELIVPLTLHPKNLIMIGDPNQLPATLISQTLKRSDYRQSAMQRLMNCNHPFSILKTQYRMQPSICQLSNQMFYNGVLENSEYVSNRNNIISSQISNHLHRFNNVYPRWFDEFSFIDIIGADSKNMRLSNSFENKAEAVFIAYLIKYLESTLGINASRHICVITFYAAQVACIKSYLQAIGLSSTKVYSVDSIQGSESDIVILSFVRSNNNGSVGFVNDFQRLNVALSRAKYLLISVGNFSTISQVFNNQNNKNNYDNNNQNRNQNQMNDDNNIVTPLTKMSNIILNESRLFSGAVIAKLYFEKS
eukprot:gene10022-13478_t